MWQKFSDMLNESCKNDRLSANVKADVKQQEKEELGAAVS